MPSRSPVQTRVSGLLLYLRQNFYSLSRRRVFVIKKQSHNAMYFNKEQFVARLHLPLPFLFKQFLNFTQISLAFFHPNVAWVLMGCNILDMLYRLNLSLLEVLFIYMVKMSQNEKFSLAAHILSFHLVTGLPNSNKGEAKGHVLVSGPWSGLYEGSNKVFYP